jgi:undecaprenyl-diphosphatase
VDLSFIELLKVVVLGIIEGITEWLPVSSTGHMLLAETFMGTSMTDAFRSMFMVVIQLGAILAVVKIYWADMWPFLKKNGQIKISRKKFNMWMRVAVAFIPSGLIGFFLDDFLEAHLSSPVVIALMLIIYGIAFILVENWNKHRQPSVHTLEDIGYKTALMIGAFQILSLIPGTSRSGATIVGALIIGVSRVAAAEFTFYLAVPTMFIASFYRLIQFGLNFTFAEFIALVVGMVVAYFVSIFVIKFLMTYIRKHDFKVFGWYRIIVGVLVLILIVTNVI